MDEKQRLTSTSRQQKFDVEDVHYMLTQLTIAKTISLFSLIDF